MNINEDRNKDWHYNLKLCVVWKLPFSDHEAIKLTQNYVLLTNPCISLFLLSSIICEYLPEVIERLNQL